MALNLAPLDNASRLLIEATLRVAPGTGGRFQPTGFPDLGPALYKGFQRSSDAEESTEQSLVQVDMLLVESVQSMANRLEEVCLQGEDYNSDCQGIPYVRILDGHKHNAFLTSSVREPHRLASPYVLGAKHNGQVFRETLKNALQANKQRPVHIWKIASDIFSYDPGCVLHGIFLEEIDGRIRLSRLVSGNIEACSPNQANSGGVYRGEVTAKDNIPYSRQEFTSPAIKASFILHIATLNSYNLESDKRRFLQLWALYKIDKFLNGYLRLRTACEFEVAKIMVSKDGKPFDIVTPDNESGNSWPNTAEILSSFLEAKNKCFPIQENTDEWGRRNVKTAVFSVDIEGKEELPDGLSAADFNLTDFDERASVKEESKGKGTRKRTFNSLALKGDWPEEDQQKLLGQNPEKKENEDGEEIENRAHAVVKAAIKKWTEAYKKQKTKLADIETIED